MTRRTPDRHVPHGTPPMEPLIEPRSEPLLQMGFHVFKLAPDSKSPPKGSHGVWDATNDTARIKRWLAATFKPNPPNLGIACGHDGLIVIDIDVKGERDGLRTLDTLQREHGVLPPSLNAFTPSGGRHMYYRTTRAEEIRSTSNKLGDGIDVRSVGGYVVAPPSSIDGRSYRWDNPSATIADLPPEWETLLIVPSFRPQGRGQTTVADDDNWTLPDAKDMLDHIDADIDHDDWVRVGFALYNKFGAEGFDVWDDWSRRGAKYTKGETTKRWKSFDNSDSAEPASMGTLVYLAREGGWSKQVDITSVYRMMKANRPWRSVAHKLLKFGLPAKQEKSIATDIAEHYKLAESGDDINLYLDERRHTDDKSEIYWSATDKNGTPRPTPVNISIAMLKGMADTYKLEYDTFLNQVSINGAPFSDNHLTEIRTTIERMFKFVPGKNDTYDEVLRIAGDNEVDCLMDYLDTLPPATGEALPAFMALLGLKENTIGYDMVYRCLVSAVARAYNPGQKVDTALILVGKQGSYKSSLFRALCPDPEWFGDNMRALSSKDDLMQLGGKWFIELAELSAIRRQTAEEVKHFLSLRSDEYRPPYGRAVRVYPRRSIFVGTTNEAQFLTDTTGNRRFWPIHLEPYSKPIYWLESNRNHLWADVVAAYRGGAKWWLEGREAADMELATDGFRLEHPWFEPIEMQCSHASCFKTAWILEEVLGIDTAHANQTHSIMVNKILRSMGFDYKQVWVGEGVKTRSKHKLWCHPDEELHEKFRAKGVYIGGEI